MSSEDVVRRVVYLQRTSPNFGEYCVMHVTDPSHLFLYSDRDTTDRRLYLRLLDEARTKEQRRQQATVAPGGTTTAAAPTAGRAGGGASRLFIPSAARGTGGRGRLALSLYDVRLLWENLDELFVAPVTETPGSSTTRARGRSRVRGAATHAVGPHAPHLFPSPRSLREFVEDVLTVAAQPDAARVDQLVEHMLQCLPRTEGFLYVGTYISEELLGFAAVEDERSGGAPVHDEDTGEACAGGSRGATARESQGHRRPSPRSDTSSGDAEDGDAKNNSSEPAVVLVDAAAAVLYLFSRLLSAHRYREAALASAALPNGGTRAEPQLTYYQAVFNQYLPRMAATAAEFAGKFSPHLRATSSSALSFVHDTVLMWAAERSLTSVVPAETAALQQRLEKLELLLATATNASNEGNTAR